MAKAEMLIPIAPLPLIGIGEDAVLGLGGRTWPSRADIGVTAP
jgi:hypothetical protein